MLGNLQQPGAGGGSGGGRQPSVPPHVVSPAFADCRTLETKLSGAFTIQDTASFQLTSAFDNSNLRGAVVVSLPFSSNNSLLLNFYILCLN